MRRRRLITLLSQVVLLASLLFLCYFYPPLYQIEKSLDNSSISRRQTHLFDNLCRFAWTEPLDSTLSRRLKFPKRSSCERYNIDLFKRYPATGEFSLKNKNFTGKLDCVAQVLKGGLRPNAQDYQLGRTQAFVPKMHKRFWVNANNFIITCFTGQLVIYRKQFMGLKMENVDRLVVEAQFEVPETKWANLNTNRFSVSMLGLDSVSRAQALRHLRKTSALLRRMGSVVFEAYNKVGDNSGVNLLPILADPLLETSSLPDLDSAGDVDLSKILPSKTALNPDTIRWLWNNLSSDYVTMFNDDVMHTSRGLFHYPPDNFLGGWSRDPARFYYRPFYNHLYNQMSNWWRKCLDGEWLAEVFIDSWFRFERVFSKTPHFGFSFVSSLTHDDPNNLEFLDYTLFHRLDYLNRTGSLENTILIIFGDHGNRVHPINRYTFAGKIEERAPYLTIFVPPRFRKEFPEKYQNLKDNSQRFVSNFDLHATLKSIMYPDEKSPESRGTSLFDVQNSQKTCQDNGVISNHCLCMVDAAQDIHKLPNSEFLSAILQEYLIETLPLNCFDVNSIKCGNVTEVLMPNNYVQVWARTKISESEVFRKKVKASAIIYPYMTCHLDSQTGAKVELLTQFRTIQATQEVSIAFPPRVRASHGHCSHLSFPTDYCNCLDLPL